MKNIITVIFLMILFSPTFAQKDYKNSLKSQAVNIKEYFPTLQFEDKYKNWEEIDDYIRNEIVSFTNSNGETHYYELVEIPSGEIEWLTAAYLAQQSGGYLVCPETEEENDFVLDLVDNEAYWYTWDETHYNVKSGPPIGVFKKYDERDGSDSEEEWMWLSGNSMYCDNWDNILIEKESKKKPQSNDFEDRNSSAMCYGKLSDSVFYWGNFHVCFGDIGGEEEESYYAFVIEYETDITGTGETYLESSDIPTKFSLRQNYPNPFNPGTTISFELNKPYWTSLSIYNATGEQITTLIDERLQEGKYELLWSAKNIPSGTYFYSLSIGDTRVTKAMVLLK